MGCGGNGDRIHRHNLLYSGIGMQFLQQLSQLPSRPEERHPILFPIASPALLTVFLPNWDRGRPAALDISVICPLQRLTIQGAAASPGHALQVGESRKRDLHHAPCASAGISFIPLLFESLGGLSSLSSQTISAIGLHLGQRIGVSPADTRRQLYQKCSISLWRGNAVSWLHRFNTISPRVDGIT